MDILVNRAKHFITLESDSNLIKRGFSTVFEEPTDTDICINENSGRHFELLGEINPSTINVFGVHLYKYENGKVLETAEEERKTELDGFTQIPKAETLEEKVNNLTLAMASLMGV